jgi:hypothetical protein
MTWRDAFFLQAQREHGVRKLLNEARVEYSHQLHYLQMVTEKLAKAYAAAPGSNTPPPTTHAAFVRLLQTTKGRPDLRRQLGYADTASFREFIDSLLPLADRIEQLAPNFAGTTNPNPEYPWRDAHANEVIAPVQFDFAEFSPRSPQMIKLERLVEALIRFGI